MRKIIKCFIIFLIVFCLSNADLWASEIDDMDYLTYQEIIMSSGKLIKNFTESEKEEIKSKIKFRLTGEDMIIENQNVQASYISQVKELMENTSQTEITYDVYYTVETSMKVSFSISGSLSASTSTKIANFKADVAIKIGVEYSENTTRSSKENRTIKILVEPNSQYMVVTKGSLLVTNGYYEKFSFGARIITTFFEVVTLQSQYAALEKRTI